MVVAATTTSEEGDFIPQNGFVLGLNQETAIGGSSHGHGCYCLQAG